MARKHQFELLSEEFDEKSLRDALAALDRIPKETKKELRQMNRGFAKEGALAVRQATPAEGQHVDPAKAKKHGRGPKHKTPPGMLKKGVVWSATENSASIVGTSRKAPHFMVFEFGGGVMWRNNNGKKHRIGIRPRSPSVVPVTRSNARKVWIQRYPRGWFFFPTIRAVAGGLQDKLYKGTMAALSKATHHHVR